MDNAIHVGVGTQFYHLYEGENCLWEVKSPYFNSVKTNAWRCQVVGLKNVRQMQVFTSEQIMKFIQSAK